MRLVKNNLLVFSNIQDLKDAFVKVQMIDFSYFESLFIYLAVLYLLLLGLFIIGVAVKGPLKRLFTLLLRYAIGKLKSIKHRLRRFNLRLQFVIRWPIVKFVKFVLDRLK